jgi:hypothetical protein
LLTRDELADLAVASTLVARVMQSIEKRGGKPTGLARKVYRQMTIEERTWSRLNAAKASLLSAYREEING